MNGELLAAAATMPGPASYTPAAPTRNSFSKARATTFGRADRAAAAMAAGVDTSMYRSSADKTPGAHFYPSSISSGPSFTFADKPLHMLDAIEDGLHQATPGPGDYDVPASTVRVRHVPGVDMAKASPRKDMVTREAAAVPGPASYAQVTDPKVKRAPGFSFARSTRVQALKMR